MPLIPEVIDVDSEIILLDGQLLSVHNCHFSI